MVLAMRVAVAVAVAAAVAVVGCCARAEASVEVTFEGVYKYEELLAGSSKDLVAACPYPVEIMRHEVECDVLAWARLGLEWANSGDGNQSADGYKVLDTVNAFLNESRGAVPVSDIWAYRDAVGHTVALVGVGNGLSVVDVTVPQAPAAVGFFPGYLSVWRDIKVWGHYAYAVHDRQYAESFIDSLTNVAPAYKVPYEVGDGLMIIDLEFPRTPVLVRTDASDFEYAHNIFIETNRPYAYVCGGDVTAGLGGDAGGIRVYDLTDPTNPVSIATWDSFYVHDLMVQYRADIDAFVLYASGINESPGSPSLFLIDATTPTTGLTTISTWPSKYPLTHNAWPDVNSEYLYVTHEELGTPVSVYDIRDVHAVAEIHEVYAVPGNTGVSAHNAFVVGSELWISYYVLGAIVYDISDPAAPVLAGQYDTSHLSVGFGGAWGIFPFMLPDNGMVYVSDMQHGLFALSSKGTPAGPPPTPAPAPVPAPPTKTSLAGPYAVGTVALVVGVIAIVLGGFVALRVREQSGGGYVSV